MAAEESSLYNPGFLGAGGFHWWVGQIMDDSTWRSNIQDKKFEGTSKVPGWGYRYKVRIIGLHDQEEETIKSEQLPWAQVMYPTTAGGGQAGSKSTPNLRQGMFVFGFFLDGQEMGIPVIMGVLGNNPQTKLGQKIGDTKSNFSPTSGYAKGKDPDSNLKVADAYIKTDAKTFKEDSAAVHELETATVKLNDLYTNFSIPLASPCKEDNSDMANIQTVIKNLTNDINKIQQSLTSPIDAASKELGDIQSAIDGATESISAYMKGIFNEVAGYVVKEYNKSVSKSVDKMFPNDRQKLMEIKEEAQKLLTCLFNAINADLPGLIGAFLSSAFKKYADNPQSEEQMIAPPLPPDVKSKWVNLGKFNQVPEYPPIKILGNVASKNSLPGYPDSYDGKRYDSYIVIDKNELWYWNEGTTDYVTAPQIASLPLNQKPNFEYENRLPQRKPVPICSVEALVGNVLGATLPRITEGMNQAVSGTNTFLRDYYVQLAEIGGGIEATYNYNVFVPIQVPQSSSPTGSISNVGQRTSTITETASSIEQSISSASAIISNANATIIQAQGVGAALSEGDIFEASNIIGGDIGQLAGQAQSALNQASDLVGQGQGLLQQATSLIGDIAGDITSALSFVMSVLQFFTCDEKPKCPESKGYRFHDGSEEQGQDDKPNMTNVAEAVEATPSPPPTPPSAPTFATPRQDGIYNPTTQSINTNVNSVTSNGALTSIISSASASITPRTSSDKNVLELY